MHCNALIAHIAMCATGVHLVRKPFRFPEALLPEALEVGRPHNVDPKCCSKAKAEESPKLS